jgi:FkbM family methyltransferase
MMGHSRFDKIPRLIIMFNKAFIKEVGPLRFIFRSAIRQFYKRIAKRDHRMRLPSGEFIGLPIHNHFASEVFITGGDVDWGSEKVLYSLLTGSGTFLDVGAHIGYYSLYLLPKVSAVFCFEPDPRVRKFLEKNVETKPNIQILPCAVGAACGKALFTLERAAEVSHLSEEGEKGGNQIEVEVVTIDSFVSTRKLKIEAIKIDVEGHDTEVIAGSLDVLARQKPIVLTEARPDKVLFDLVQSVSYRVFAYVRHPSTRMKSFVELTSDVSIQCDTKMLFLIPDRLVDEVKRKAGIH